MLSTSWRSTVGYVLYLKDVRSPYVVDFFVPTSCLVWIWICWLYSSKNWLKCFQSWLKWLRSSMLQSSWRITVSCTFIHLSFVLGWSRSSSLALTREVVVTSMSILANSFALMSRSCYQRTQDNTRNHRFRWAKMFQGWLLYVAFVHIFMKWPQFF